MLVRPLAVVVIVVDNLDFISAPENSSYSVLTGLLVHDAQS
jgi:hypothetical protein